MKRQDFLKGLGLVGVGALLPLKKAFADSGDRTLSTCILTPTKEEGPFPYTADGTTLCEICNPLDRSNVTTNSSDGAVQTGVPLTLTLTVVNLDADCGVVSGARVDIWHCNKDGYYSGYANQSGGLSTDSNSYLGKDFLRGYQMTNAAGQVTFTTIFPGWYYPRATHIHLDTFVDSVLQKQTQVAFDKTIANTVQTSTLYAAHGANTTLNANDSVFGEINTTDTSTSGSAATDLTDLTLNITGSVAAGYIATYTIGVHLGTTGVKNTTSEIKVLSAYPNPVIDKLVLSQPYASADVKVRIMTIDGRSIATGILPVGATATSIDVSGFASGMYMLAAEYPGNRQVIKFVKQ